MHILETRGVHSFATLEPRFFLSLFHGRTRTADIEAIRLALRRYTTESVGPVAVLTVIGEGSTLGSHGRKLIAEMMRELDTRIEGWGITIEGQGFWSTTARAMTATVRLLSRTSLPFKVSGEHGEGLAWLQGQCRRAMPAEATATLAVMRKNLASMTPAAAR